MKKFLAFSLAFLLIVSLCACSPIPRPEPSASASPTPSAEASQSAEPSSLPAPSEEQAEAMLPIMDSIILCWDEVGYSAHNASGEYVWDVLYYLCVNYSDSLPSVSIPESDSSALSISASDALALASCFSDITELPALPEKSSVSYDQQTDTYRMLLSDRGQTRPSIQSIKQETDGSATVVVEMRSMEDNAVLDTFSFRLVANTQTAAGQFSLRIVSAERK